MASVNIGEANAGDAFYRYKMPRLMAKVQGRGNGIKTEVVNNVEIAKALDRPPEYIVKFYGCELGAQTNFDKKTGTSIVNGAHEQRKLAELLEAFIKKYVQCYECGNPETVVKVKREDIRLACKACGAVSAVDMRHRLNTYILKNPPDEKVSKAEKKLRKQEKERLKEAAGENLDKEEKRKKKREKEAKKKRGASGDGSPTEGGEGGSDNADGGGGGSDDDDGSVEWMADTSAAAAERRAQEQLTAAMAGMVTQGNIEAEQAAARRREEKRKAEEAAAIEAAAEAERQAREEAERAAVAEAARSPAERLRAVLSAGETAAAMALLEGLPVDKGPAERMSVLLQAIFEGAPGGKLAPALVAEKAVVKAAAHDPPTQMAQLIALEQYFTLTAPEQQNQVMHVLKVLYDEDIIEEEIITAWHSRPGTGRALGVPDAGAAAVRKAAAPFVAWLEEAEESDEESE